MVTRFLFTSSEPAIISELLKMKVRLNPNAIYPARVIFTLIEAETLLEFL